jgi:aspartyl-tRNA(Asn)/glutamyl-tRNA(Gln) amidotransferase subunit A
MTAITELTLQTIIHHLRSGELSSLEVTTAFLEQIERLEPELCSFITRTPELAIHQAQEADRRLKIWRTEPESPISPLLGVPIAIKDLLCLENVPCTCGSRILENFLPPYNATAVGRLLDAGVSVLGKTNTDEFAMGSSTENSAYGHTHNPWDGDRVTGGSSGGSAAAVAARMAPIALGTDTGGSVRQPAAFCGITGLKPTYGRVSRYGLVAFGSSLDVIGVLATSAVDTALVFGTIAGHDPLDATSSNIPVDTIDLTSSDQNIFQGMRIGIPDEYFIPGLQTEIDTSVQIAVEQIEKLGAQVQQISLPHTSYAVPTYYMLAPAEASANLARYDGIRYGSRIPADTLGEIYRQTRGEKFGHEVKRRIMLGTYALSAGYYDAYYGQAQKVRTLIKRDFEKAFEEIDLIATPVTPNTAFPIGEHRGDPLAMYLEDIFTLPGNLAGIPGISFPVGFDSNGLPIGMQLMAPHFQEAKLLQAVHAYQSVTEWHTKSPPISIKINNHL